MMNSYNIVQFILSIIVIIGLCSLMGRIMRLAGQPRVIGEMIAGVMLGPSLLGSVSPQISELLFPEEIKPLLHLLSNAGLGIYMFLIGLEIDRQLLNKRNLSHCTFLSIMGIVPSFIFGITAGLMYFHNLAPAGTNRYTFVLYMAVALSITAFPVLARIIQERRLHTTPIGALTLFSASIEDIVAWALVTVVISLSQSASVVSGLFILVGCGVYVILMLTLFRWWMARIGEQVIRQRALSLSHLALIIGAVLLSMGATEYLGVHAVFGGFMAGIVMPQDPLFKQLILNKLKTFITIGLLPLFSIIRLNTNLKQVFNVQMAEPMIMILVFAIVGKLGGCSLAMRSIGYTWRESTVFGILMNTRGSMLLIPSNIGLTYGIISESLFSILVIVAVTTTLLTVPLLNLVSPKADKQRQPYHAPEGDIRAKPS